MKRNTRIKTNCNQKQLYIGNLNTDVVEEDLNQPFGIRSAKYLQDTTEVYYMYKNASKSKDGKIKDLPSLQPRRMYI